MMNKKPASKKIFSAITAFGLFLLLVFLLYNQITISVSEPVLAAPSQGLSCGKEIPNGEALEKTDALLNALMSRLNQLDKDIYKIAEIAKRITALSKQCNPNECKPSCQVVDCFPCIGSGCKNGCCKANSCTSQWQNKSCPAGDIEEEYNKMSDIYDEINQLKKEIWALIDGENEGVDEKESLCDKTNEDIRNTNESSLCKGCLSGSSLSCPATRKSKIEIIQRKLNKAREDFNQCSPPPGEWGKVFNGQTSPKFPLNCQMVESQNLPRETKTIVKVREEAVPVCTSPLNYFCCK